MIHDSIKNYKNIENLHPLFKKAFDFIKNTDLAAMEDGKYELEGDRLYLGISVISAKSKENARLETHAKYIDIQLPLQGVETIGWKTTQALQKQAGPYNQDKDITFFDDSPTTFTTIYPGEFTVYFPEDGHAPGIGEGAIRKVVVKVKI